MLYTIDNYTHVHFLIAYMFGVRCELCCLLGSVQTSGIYGKVTQLLLCTRRVKVIIVMRVS
jgi:hypothetical protein